MKQTAIFMTIVCLALISIVANQGFSQGAGGGKALKVLTFKSTHETFQYMAKINRELGVQCNFCHNLPDYAAAHPQKDKTRDMIKMVQEMNSNYFSEDSERQITCWTCHRGAPVVESAE